MAHASSAYLHAWYNETWYDFDHNGEAFALRQFARWSGGRSVAIWDVGAHRGEWSDTALGIMPSAEVHSFEVIPSIAADIPPKPHRTVHVTGLSNKTGEADVYHNITSDTGNTFQPWLGDHFFKDSVKIACQTIRGDELVGAIGAPDLLKVDTEGHEVAVLEGCRGLLNSPSAPAMLQLEYGVTYIRPGRTLLDLHTLLPDYSIGRLYPDHVDFKPYRYEDEHFRMDNIIAVRDERLKHLLAG